MEPELFGPFKSNKTRDNEARRLRNERADQEDVVFWVNLKGTDLSVGSYSNAFMEGQD